MLSVGLRGSPCCKTWMASIHFHYSTFNQLNNPYKSSKKDESIMIFNLEDNEMKGLWMKSAKARLERNEFQKNLQVVKALLMFIA